MNDQAETDEGTPPPVEEIIFLEMFRLIRQMDTKLGKLETKFPGCFCSYCNTKLVAARSMLPGEEKITKEEHARIQKHVSTCQKNPLNVSIKAMADGIRAVRSLINTETGVYRKLETRTETHLSWDNPMLRDILNRFLEAEKSIPEGY